MKHPQWKLIHLKMTEDRLGAIPYWLDEDDPRSATEQIDAHYKHGGGWTALFGFKLLADNSLHYPDDPDLKPLAEAHLRDELIIFYSDGWIAVIQPDRSFEAARID